MIKTLVFNPIAENTYVLWDDTRECAVIDAGNYNAHENAALDAFIAAEGLTPVLALNTHGHFDHVMGVEHLRRKYGVRFALNAQDAFLLDAAPEGSRIYGVQVGPMPATIDIDLSNESTIRFGHTELQIIPTPGHTPGHVAFYAPGFLFTGDTLFKESIGRTDLPGGDYSWIMRSILDNLMPLPGQTVVYPGHGESTTLGHEALYNPFIVEVLNSEVRP